MDPSRAAVDSGQWMCEEQWWIHEERWWELRKSLFSDDGTFKDTDNVTIGQHFVIDGQEFWIPTVPKKMKPKECGHYPSRRAIEEIYYTYACAACFDVWKNTKKKRMVLVMRCSRLIFLRFNDIILPYVFWYE
ncbi:hypothetical protein LXL04_024962 [Taraxacum kok-saghyz]